MKKSVKKPQIWNAQLAGLEDRPNSELVARTELQSARYTNILTPHLELAHAHLDQVHFNDVNADTADFSGTSFSEVALSSLDIPLLNAPHSRWLQTKVTGRIGALTGYESFLRAVHFVGCKFGFINLRTSDIVDVTFTDCLIDELDIGGAKCQRLQLSHTSVGTLDVRRATLTDVDLRGASIKTIVGLGNLAGATFTPEQITQLAPLLASHIGLLVQSEQKF